MKKDLYTCVRCGYVTNDKSAIRKHFYKLKNVCPGSKNTIELTDEIKQHILANRIYHLPEHSQTINIINYNNTINNLIANMDVIEKIKKYLSYNDSVLLEYGDTIENKFKKHVERLEAGTRDDLALDKHSLLEIINQVSSLANEQFENLNIMYDDKFNKLKLYELGTWNESLVISGIRTLLTKIQEFYFDQYECYLIRKIEFSRMEGQRKQELKEHLHEYYKFIGCFDIDPYVKGKNDSEIIYNQDDERYDPFKEYTDENTELPIRYANIYNKIRDETMKSQLNKIKKEVVDIIKKNSKKNIDDLNKKMVALFNMDEDFKKIILP